MRIRSTSGWLWLVLVMVTAGSLLAGCGQRGPLYLPDDAGKKEQESR